MPLRLIRTGYRTLPFRLYLFGGGTEPCPAIRTQVTVSIEAIEVIGPI